MPRPLPRKGGLEGIASPGEASAFDKALVAIGPSAGEQKATDQWPLLRPRGFEELVAQLCSEHERLRQLVEALAEENQALRNGQRAGEVVAPVVAHASSATSASELQSATPRDVVAHCGSQLSDDSGCAPALQLSQRGSDRRKSSGEPVQAVRENAGTHNPGHEDESFSGNSMQDRLMVCTQKLRAVFELTDARGFISAEHIVELLRRKKCYTDDRKRNVEQLIKLMVAVNPPKLSSTRSLSSNRLSNKSPRRKAVDEVPVFRLAELMLTEDPCTLVPDCPPKIVEDINLIRQHVFRQDNLGILPTESEVNEREDDAKFDRHLDIAMNIVILANCVSIGLTTGVSSDEWGAPEIVDIVFTLIFTLEMLIKLRRYGLRKHFWGHDWIWNFFDAIIVASGIIDAIMNLLLVYASTFNPSLLKVLRLLRVGRLLRVIRMSLFRELQLMIRGIVGLLKTLGCACILLLLTVYFLGVCLVQIVGPIQGDETEVVTAQDMLFASLPRSMFTVFRCLIVGDCSTVDGTPINMHLAEAMGWPYIIGYGVCTVLVNYGLGSLITALVVDTTLNEAKKAEFRNTLKEGHRKKIGQTLQDLAILFEREQAKRLKKKKNADGYGPMMLFLDRETFMAACHKQEVCALLDAIDIDESDRTDLFDALDADGNGHLEIDELIEGLVRMSGKARKADTVASRLKVNSMMKRLSELHTEITESHRRIIECLEALGGRMFSPMGGYNSTLDLGAFRIN